MLEKPSYIYDLLKLVNQQPARNMEVRETLRLVEPRFNTVTYGARSFEITAPRLFNKLPSEVKNCGSVNVFRNKLKTYLFSKAYDTDAQVMNSEYKIH